ncbi:MAG: hypothetical protein DRQ24_02560 [Candidatus Latescibacterota bacterium]|nr:MAG: hypothetical protein DRQ24_02560 [Candidatus Latescibacterota bacterium]
MKRFVILALGLVSLLAIWDFGHAQPATRRPGPRLMGDQRESIRHKVEELKAQGASSREIRRAVRQMLEHWGIKRPPRPRLNEEQRAEIREMVNEMKQTGGSPAEIREAVAEKLREWGVKPPRKRLLPGIIFSRLTDDQRVAIRQKVEELKTRGASREEVREVVRQMLDDWGIKPPPRPRLTEEQRAEIREMVKEMKEAGASPKEIRSAVRAKLQEWGVRPAETSAKPTAPSAVEPATWGQVKSQFK